MLEDAHACANQEEANYLPNYHAASDTLESGYARIEAAYRARCANGLGIADRAEPLATPRTRRLDISSKKPASPAVKALGYWDAWQSVLRPQTSLLDLHSAAAPVQALIRTHAYMARTSR